MLPHQSLGPNGASSLEPRYREQGPSPQSKQLAVLKPGGLSGVEGGNCLFRKYGGED